MIWRPTSRAAMENIGKYQIVEKIGEGGFGVIYKGTTPS